MKPIFSIFFSASLLGLLITTPLLATDTLTNPGRNLSSASWVSAPDASFSTRAYQTDSGELVILVNNQFLGSLTIQVQTNRGEEVAYIPVPERQSAFGAKLGVHELPDGDYRIIVSTHNERIATIISLKSIAPTHANHRATVAVVNLVTEP